MATIYSDVYSGSAITNGLSYRTQVVYSVAQADTTITLSGTIAIQAKGTFSGTISNDFAKIAGDFLHSSWSSGMVNTRIDITPIVTRSRTSYSSWTTLSSKSFSVVWDKYRSAHTEYLFPVVRFFASDGTERGGYGRHDPGVALIIPAKTSYTVSYNANGGANAPNSQVKYHGESLTLTGSVPTRSGYAFASWNTMADGSGTSYSPKAAYTANAALSLYAIWAAVPQIESLTAIRCNSQGANDDEGTYCRVACEWSLPSGSITGIVGAIERQGGATDSFSLSGQTSGSSGTATAFIANVGVDHQYLLTVTVSNGAQSTSRTVILTRAFYIMDFKAGGGGIGIGRAAPSSGLEIGYDTAFDGDVTFLGKVNRAQKVLWSGAWYMNGNQTITLSENVSDQPLGIVLAWSAYGSNGAIDGEWVYTFIPKAHIALPESLLYGNYTTIILASSGFSSLATKMLRIDDGSISGYAHNTGSGTSNGITYDNRKWVLRYVYGV